MQLKRFWAHLISESSDHYDMEWRGNRLPETDEEWMRVKHVYFEGWDEIEYMNVESCGESSDKDLDEIILP